MVALSLPWGVILLMLVAVALYFGLFRGALECWQLSVEGGFLLLLLLIGGNFITIPWQLETQVVQIHLGTLFLLGMAGCLCFFQSGLARRLWLAAAAVLALVAAFLVIAGDRNWFGSWFQLYLVLPLVIGGMAAILTRNIAGVLWLTLAPTIVGESLAALYFVWADGLWFAVGSSQIFDIALLTGGMACLLVTAMQLLALHRLA